MMVIEFGEDIIVIDCGIKNSILRKLLEYDINVIVIPWDYDFTIIHPFLEEKEEDFGQTLATWGVGDGFYIVLPLFGPSNLRDTTGMVMTYVTDPINAYAINEGEAWVLPVRTATNAIDQRSKIIDEVNALRNNSVDYYAAVRSSYYQNRKAAIENTDDNILTPLPLISIEFD